LLNSEKKFESNFINIKPRTSNPIFSKIFCNPTLDPFTVPKQPQLISKPLNKLISTAIIKTISKPLMIAEFSLTEIPNIRRTPALNSIQGKSIAKILTRKSGRSL
jgi:hypothetical protein